MFEYKKINFILKGLENVAGTRGLILVPTRELCEQVSDVIKQLTQFCHHLVRYLFISNEVSIDAQKHRLGEIPDIVVATPGRLLQHLEKGVRKKKVLILILLIRI